MECFKGHGELIISNQLVASLAGKEMQVAKRQKVLPNCGAVLLLPVSPTYPVISNSSICAS